MLPGESVAGVWSGDGLLPPVVLFLVNLPQLGDGKYAKEHGAVLDHRLGKLYGGGGSFIFVHLN